MQMLNDRITQQPILAKLWGGGGPGMVGACSFGAGSLLQCSQFSVAITVKILHDTQHSTTDSIIKYLN